MLEDLGILWVVGAYVAGVITTPIALFLYIIQDNDDF
ncbi:hypothetical protein IWQ55_006400 [Labrenzia sp. EL_208]|nr:hypothetical protein [Labrenzia sp. EL_132]MBG6233165.1 hypothetical protein [Labrenzia sp. EL_208]